MDANEIDPLTEPLSAREWARFFGFGRRKIVAVLKHIEGAVQVERRWQLPLSKAPVPYWLSRGILQPKEIDLDQNGAVWRIRSRTPPGT